MTVVYFIRHAQSDRNFHDERTRPLTEEGFSDSEKVAKKLKDKGITRIISSPYTRTLQTVESLSRALKLETETDERLRERGAGKWHGDKFFDFVRRQWEDFDYRIEGGESLRQVQDRNIEALGEILKKYRGGIPALSVHGTALSTVLNYFYPEYGFDCFLKIADLMPLVLKATFEENRGGIVCAEVREIFSVRKSYK